MDKHPEIEDMTRKKKINRQLWEVARKKNERYFINITR